VRAWGPDGLGTGAQGRGREGAESVDVDYAHEGWGQALDPAQGLMVSAHEMYAGFWMMQTNGFSARDY